MRYSEWDRVSAFGCGHELINQKWDFKPPSPAPYGTLCNYHPAIGSWAFCVNQTISEHVVNHIPLFNSSIHWVNLVCQKAGGGAPVITFENFYDILVNSTLNIRPIPQEPTKLNFPIILNNESRRKLINGVHSEFSNLDNANDSVLLIYWYFGILLILLFVVQLPKIRRRLMATPTVNKLRSKFQLPTMWMATKHSQNSFWALGGMVPSSLEASILLWFNVVHLIALLYNYSIDQSEALEPVFLQYLQALGNRSGILAFGMLPLIICFSTRCHLLQRFIGLKYSTMLVLHRWIGRLIVVDSVIHSFVFYWHSKLTGELQKVSYTPWWILGIYSTMVLCVLFVWGTGILRRNWYEIFLYSHILLALTFFYLCWQHVKLFGWTNWIWVTCMFWAFDRMLRIYLVAKFGVIEAEVFMMDGLIVIYIPKPSDWYSFPSHYAFIYFLIPRVFWQSHPFTLVDIGDSLKAVIAVKDGVTKALQKAVTSQLNTDSSAKINVLLEGPYGRHCNLDDFDYVLIIGGGSGVPGPLAIADSLSANSDAKIIIVVRYRDVIEAYKEQISNLSIPVDIYYTGGVLYSSSDNPVHTVYSGRPNFLNILADVIHMYDSIAVVCCGSPPLNDHIRNIVADSLEKNPGKIVEYVEEFQVW